MKRRLIIAALAVAALLVPFLGYGMLIEPRLFLNEQRLVVPVPRLDEEWAGAEVALVADFQFGMWFANEDMAERAVARIVDEQPDVVLLGGDFIYGEGDPPGPKIRAVMELLAPLVLSGIPTYAVLGNHDYAAGGAVELALALEQAGIPVLVNEAVRLPAPQGEQVASAHPLRSDRPPRR